MAVSASKDSSALRSEVYQPKEVWGSTGSLMMTYMMLLGLRVEGLGLRV